MAYRINKVFAELIHIVKFLVALVKFNISFLQLVSHFVKLRCKENDFIRRQRTCNQTNLSFIISFCNCHNPFKKLADIDIQVI